ncbi:MAG: hypothetical protein H7336_14355 [Bacteriovorax sp.]|nr:hypothetical protein [Bacteriovorax sp.]
MKYFLLSILFVSSLNAFAQSEPKFTWDGNIPLEGVTTTDAHSENVRMDQAEILLTDQLSENIKASIKLKLDRDLILDGAPVPQNFNFEDFIKAAHIEIKNIGGKPVAFVIGKQEIAYGFDNTMMPIPKESPVHELGVHNEVVGFTVVLDTNFQLFDKIEASVFETKDGDLKIGTIDGYAVRFSKDVTKQIQVKASAMHLGNGDNLELGVENRQDIGIIVQSKDGKWTFWNENIHFDNNPDYRDSHYAISAGLSHKLGQGQLAIDATLIPQTLKRVGIGYNMNLSKHVIVGAEANYTTYNAGTDLKNGMRYGVSIRYVFGGHSNADDAKNIFKNLKRK